MSDTLNSKSKSPDLVPTGILQSLFTEIKWNDIKSRHIMTAPIRVALFIASWILLLLFTPHIWTEAPWVPVMLTLGFILTTYCHYYVLHHSRINIVIVTLEVLADVICQTAIVYVLGTDSMAPFMIYGLYLTAVGILTGYHLTLFASLIVLFVFDILFLLIEAGVITPYDYSPSSGGVLSGFPYVNLFLLPLALIVIIYTIRISYYFSSLREKALERKNQQLGALQRISETIRRLVEPNLLIDQVVKAVMNGLGFNLCFLVLRHEPTDSKFRMYFPYGHKDTDLFFKIMGVMTDHLTLNVESSSSISQAVRLGKISVRNNLSEMLIGMEPELEAKTINRAQAQLGIRKWVITPLVVERRIIGALVGGSRKDYIEDESVESLNHFSNQAAMAIENSRLMSALEQKNQQLEEASRVKSEFLAIMSHELRTPLNAVIGYAEALLDGVLGPINQDQNQSLDEILINAKRLLDLINNTLDLAKLESGRMELNLDDFDMLSLAEEVCSSLAPLARRKSIKLEAKTIRRLPIIRADLMKIRQILVNLVGNALKFTADSGAIHVEVDYVDGFVATDYAHYHPQSALKNIPDQPAFVIHVRDNGSGIAEHDLSGIFESFRQADSSSTRRHEGTGLGLTLSKELAELHSGAILVQSKKGYGSNFCLVIPQFTAQGS